MSRLADLVAQIRRFYDPVREPLRRSVYTSLLSVVALAVLAGAVTGSVGTALVGPLAVLLAVPAVEEARSRVTPTAAPTTDAAPGKHAKAEVPDDGS